MKENRKVVLCTREMPLGKVHLRNMSEAADLGCTIIPPMLTFYNGARSLDDQINHVVGKILMQFGLDLKSFVPWHGAE
jgi:4-hydroxy-3-polyprenylbenzoate decarboxylase